MESAPAQTRDLTVEDYLAHLAAPGPTPGGGSAVAIAAALAAALAEMVAGITLAGKHDPQDSAALRAARDGASSARLDLLQLASDDETAYAAYRAATALPKSDEEERANRRAAIQSALSGSTEVPLAIARVAASLLDPLAAAARFGSKHALSDVSAAALLADAAVRGALATADVNIALLRDATSATGFRTDVAIIRAEADRGITDVRAALAGRQSS